VGLAESSTVFLRPVTRARDSSTKINFRPCRVVRGRPTIRSRAIENEIFYRIANGESLRHICLDPKMPCRDTVFRWLRQDRVRHQMLRNALMQYQLE